MPQYKLHYFHSRGRAEVARYMLAYGKIDYEDVRYEKEQWAEFKPKTPFGQMPILEVDGVLIGQSRALGRFLGKRLGLYGKCDVEDAKQDMVVDCLEDVMKPMAAVYYEEDETRKAALKKKFADSLPGELQKLENLMGGNYFLGDKLSWADFELGYCLDFPAMIGCETKWDDLPKLKAMRENIVAIPEVAAWIAKRPETKN